MQRYLLCSLALLAACISSAYAIPARPLYVPPDPPKAPVPPRPVSTDLRGTAWLGKYNTINRVYIFEADGTVSYRTAAGKAVAFKGRGTWRVEGNMLVFEHLQMEFRGVIRDNNSIVGEAVMKTTGAKQQQTLQRTTLDN